MTKQDNLEKLLCLYAVIPAKEPYASIERSKYCRVITCGPLSAVVGDAPTRSTDRREAALHHSSIIQEALEACRSVIPFRFGVGLRTEAELEQLLKSNTQLLVDQLERLRNQVEMGLKAKLSAMQHSVLHPASSFGPAKRLIEQTSNRNVSFDWNFELNRVRSLATHECHRKECVKTVKEATVFTGCYLIARESIERYWALLDDIRRRMPSVPLLGSGPWAPYHFCEFALHDPSRDC